MGAAAPILPGGPPRQELNASMHLRTRYRLSAVPLPIVVSCVVCVLLLVALIAIPPVTHFLADQIAVLPWIFLAAAGLVSLLFPAWYTFTFADVRGGRLRVQSLFGGRDVQLRRLVAADVHAKARSGNKRRRHELILRLQDEDGQELWLPLNNWRDEDLLMARLLRATVERRVRIDGDPLLVRRFSGLLDTYKSWDRQQAA